jgi:hypothetical protein
MLKLNWLNSLSIISFLFCIYWLINLNKKVAKGSVNKEPLNKLEENLVIFFSILATPISSAVIYFNLKKKYPTKANQSGRVGLFFAVLFLIGYLILYVIAGIARDIEQKYYSQNGPGWVDLSATSTIETNLSTSSDESLLALTKSVGNIISDETGDKNYNELWLSNLKSGKKELLAKSGPISFSDKESPTEFYNIKTAVFSNDNKILYFLASYYATSDALFSINLESKEIKFICGSNYLDVIKTGKYKDNLVTNQHRYFDGGGSYYRFYITNPKTGNDIKEVGDSLDNFKF